ncbi:MAG: hypothetical protein B7733_06350 [Myxococcales bacterium FL481]|nr:MAG: hypothetical protein B7733_06350 [Myxococcales bacterium FL481]
MVIAGKSLASGDLPTSQAAIYTAPVGTTAYVKGIRTKNTTGLTALVELWVKESGGTARSIGTWTGRTLEFCLWVTGDAIVLEPGDAIEAVSDRAGVDYVISGGEEA